MGLNSSDIFTPGAFDSLGNFISAVDTLTDFTPSQAPSQGDKIGLRADSFSNLIRDDGLFDPNEFTTLANFDNNQDANLVYDRSEGIMYYIDENNNRIEFMRLNPGLNIDDDDFEII